MSHVFDPLTQVPGGLFASAAPGRLSTSVTANSPPRSTVPGAYGVVCVNVAQSTNCPSTAVRLDPSADAEPAPHPVPPPKPTARTIPAANTWTCRTPRERISLLYAPRREGFRDAVPPCVIISHRVRGRDRTRLRRESASSRHGYAIRPPGRVRLRAERADAGVVLPRDALRDGRLVHGPAPRRRALVARRPDQRRQRRPAHFLGPARQCDRRALRGGHAVDASARPRNLHSTGDRSDGPRGAGRHAGLPLHVGRVAAPHGDHG